MEWNAIGGEARLTEDEMFWLNNLYDEIEEKSELVFFV